MINNYTAFSESSKNCLYIMVWKLHVVRVLQLWTAVWLPLPSY